MINMRAIFKEPAIKLITDAKLVLERWKQSYMTMRQRIEESGRDNRWEFDRNKLFARTDYMAQRCGDLLYVAEMLRDMRAMLGPELKAVTGDAKGIDEVMSRVEALVVPLEMAPFDLFDRRYQTSWEGTMGKFRENVAAINETLQKFMDDSFTKLRNAEGAFDLLQKFRSMPQSQEAQAKLMERKTFDILTQCAPLHTARTRRAMLPTTPIPSHTATCPSPSPTATCHSLTVPTATWQVRGRAQPRQLPLRDALGIASSLQEPAAPRRRHQLVALPLPAHPPDDRKVSGDERRDVRLRQGQAHLPKVYHGLQGHPPVRKGQVRRVEGDGQ